jgi:putative ABC transport system substrate-binding protein
LRELGYIEGQNIAIEYRNAEGKFDRLPELAAELVRVKVDIIVVAGGVPVIRPVKDATNTIPIVMLGVPADPVEAGLVESLARPGGNVTGSQRSPESWRQSGWSCSKKPFPKLPVPRFSTVRALNAM